MNQGLAIHYDPRLVEETVFHAQRNSYIRQELDEQRNRIYEVADPDERERLFLDLYRTWFDRLGLSKVIEDALSEQPVIAAQVGNCFIVCGAQAKEESAELFVVQDARCEHRRRTLRVVLRPESLLNSVSLKAFLRHEFFHIADMLDPAFAYEPTLPKAPGGPTHHTLIINRYRVLWNVTIDGRMARRGWCSGSVRDQQFSDFVRAFPMLHEEVGEFFGKFFDLEQPKHCDLARFAFDPRQASGNLRRTAPGTHCPLCKFPTHAYEAAPSSLGADILTAIKKDFPNWSASLGLCTQCADLYRAGQMSLAAAKLLPGWNSCLRAD
jgi:hypothetical protein